MRWWCLHSARPHEPSSRTRPHTAGTVASRAVTTMHAASAVSRKRRSGPVRTARAAGTSVITTVGRVAASARSPSIAASGVTTVAAGPVAECDSQVVHSHSHRRSLTTTSCQSAGPYVAASCTTTARADAVATSRSPRRATIVDGARTNGTATSWRVSRCSTATSRSASRVRRSSSESGTGRCHDPRPIDTRSGSLADTRRSHVRASSAATTSSASTTPRCSLRCCSSWAACVARSWSTKRPVCSERSRIARLRRR